MNRALYIIANPFNFSRQSVGGNISSASGVINGFRELGYCVDVVTDSKVPTLEEDAPNLVTIFYPYRFIRSIIPYNLKGFLGRLLNKFDHMFFRYAMKKKVEELIKFNSYDFCYMRASYNGHVAAKVIKKNNIDLILEVNKPLSMGPYNAKDKLDWPKKNQKVKVPQAEKIQYECAKVITIDSSIRAKWVTEFVDYKYNKKILVNPNGVNTEMFSPGNLQEKTIKELDVSQEDILIGMASSFRWYNDIDELCLILSKALKKMKNLKFIMIVGNKEKEIELKSKIKNYGLNDNTKILFQVPFYKMPEVLNCCDILLSHFNFHGRWPHNCSIKHLEYLSLGKPTIATDVGEVNFAIENEVNGILCKEGDIENFANAIIRLAKEPELRHNFGISGRSKALKEHSWKANVSRILNFYSKLN